MKWMRMYLAGYVMVLVGLIAALWKLGVVERVGPVWAAIGIVIAIGLGVMFSVSSSGNKETVEIDQKREWRARGFSRRRRAPDRIGETDMAGGKTDELKGRVKEAAGALTGDEKLKREGQVDQAVGKIKQTTDEIIDKVKEAVK